MTMIYMTGDATKVADHFKSAKPTVYVLAHVVNNYGVMGAGIARQIKEKWPDVFKDYAEYCNKKYSATAEYLGDLQFIKAQKQNKNDENELYVANIFAQDGFPSHDNRCALKYGALALSLRLLSEEIEYQKICYPDKEIVVNMPKIGSGLAGGDWNLVSKIVEEFSEAIKQPVFVWTL